MTFFTLLSLWFFENKTKANPEKIQAIAVGQQIYNENIPFNTENNGINLHVRKV